MTHVQDKVVQYLKAKGQDNNNNIWEAAVGDNATLVNTINPFNGTTMALSGSNEYITLPDSDNYNFAGGDFTIQYVLSFDTGVSGTEGLTVQRATKSTDNAFYIRRNSNDIYFAYTTNGVTQIESLLGTYPWVIGQIYNIVISRRGSYIEFWVDEVLRGSIYIGIDVIYNSTQPLIIGAVNSGYILSYLDAHINGILIYKGKALTSVEQKQNYNDVMDIGTSVINDANIAVPLAMVMAQGYDISVTVHKDINILIPLTSASASGYNPTISTGETDRLLVINTPIGIASSQTHTPIILNEDNATIDIPTNTVSAILFLPQIFVNQTEIIYDDVIVVFDREYDLSMILDREFDLDIMLRRR